MNISCRKLTNIFEFQLNFATEFMADEAIARAKELDAYYKKTGKLVGPLVSDLGHQNMR
jgi:hypothetical protein